ncbi:OmpA family protein [uncultured Psychroserpens sp.]|uniref:OmpA family protein n=1 Tax=uncultured Psychroserpens sp. TaxID=255436 RepID=UPI00261C4176|nr:OmpA family protein [uncultured Psychroserpens sp.]
MKRDLVTLLLILLVLVSGAQADLEGSQDYYLLDRLPEYYISEYSDVEFDKHKFFIDGKNVFKEGKKYTIKYKHKKENTKGYEFPTRLQILRNYSSAIVNAGGQIIFERYNHEHGYYSFEVNGKVLWIQVKPSKIGGSYVLYIIEEQSMRQDVFIDAELIKNSLEIEGRIAIYGIYFDTGKAIVKPESNQALEQIAKFLKDNPSTNCWVVGHTDSDGSFQINSTLSLDRAKAVKMVLENTYNIEAGRLFAEGVGPLAPIATNSTDEGKQLNRRVELVKK